MSAIAKGASHAVDGNEKIMLNNVPTSFRHDRYKEAAKRRRVGYALLLLVILALLYGPLSAFTSFLLHTTLRPLLMAEYTTLGWVAEARQMLATKQSLIQENERLSDALDLVSLEAYSRERLQRENEELRAALGRAGERDLLLARVLATPGRSPYDTLLIDVGTNEGLLAGMKVETDGNFVLGEVSRVEMKSAVVTLYSSYGKELPVNIGTSSIPAVARGEGGGNFRMTLPRGAPVGVGDLVEIPAFFPHYTGVVEAIERKEGGSLQDLHIKLPLNVNELRWVYVVISERSSGE